MCKKWLVVGDIVADHKNGVNSDNKLENCQLLCGSCHNIKHANDRLKNMGPKNEKKEDSFEKQNKKYDKLLEWKPPGME
jgi:5-methylcytosine-specific restriction endonuclease McrA